MGRLAFLALGLVVGVGLWIDAGVRAYRVDHLGIPGELTIERRVVEPADPAERQHRWWEGRFVSADGRIDRTVRLESLPGDPEGTVAVGQVVPARWLASDPDGAYHDGRRHFGPWLTITLSLAGLVALVAGLVVVVRRSNRTFQRHAPTSSTRSSTAGPSPVAPVAHDPDLDERLRAGALEAEHLRAELERAMPASRAEAVTARRW